MPADMSGQEFDQQRPRGSEPGRKVEPSLSNLGFQDIQGRLRDMANHKVDPKDPKVVELQDARQVLLDRARRFGLFDQLKPQMAEIQKKITTRGATFQEVTQALSELEVDNIERTSRGTSVTDKSGAVIDKWDSKLDGIAEEYKEGVRRVTEHAYANASWRIRKDIAWKNYASDIEQRIQILNWGSIPEEDIYPLALKAVNSEVEAENQHLSRGHTAALVESLGGGSPEQERERWTDVEYEQGFYTRFQPDHEPRFYKNMGKKERDEYDARWQLARAAFFKGATSSFPEKQIENQDLTMMKKEQLERLWEIPGVKQMVRTYCVSLVNPNSAFWKIKDEKGFEEFRVRKRNQALGSMGLSDLSQKEADAIAWNLIWVSNLVESLDSRYNSKGSGERHGNLPGILVSDDIRATFHPQEKFEDKCTKRQEWGPFGKWGKTQVGRIKQELKFREGENIQYRAARTKSEYWSSRRVGNIEENHIEIFVPECYPTTTMKSFLEEIKVEVVASGEKHSLLDVILGKVPGVNDINWDEVDADPWIGYLPIKLNKTVKLVDYFAGKTPLEIDKPSGTKAWADPLIDIYTRLGFNDPKKDESFKRWFHNLKVWVAYTSTGGVKNPNNRQPEFNLTWQDTIVLNSALNSNRIRYFQRERLELI